MVLFDVMIGSMVFIFYDVIDNGFEFIFNGIIKEGKEKKVFKNDFIFFILLIWYWWLY